MLIPHSNFGSSWDHMIAYQFVSVPHFSSTNSRNIIPFLLHSVTKSFFISHTPVLLYMSWIPSIKHYFTILNLKTIKVSKPSILITSQTASLRKHQTMSKVLVKTNMPGIVYFIVFFLALLSFLYPLICSSHNHSRESPWWQVQIKWGGRK